MQRLCVTRSVIKPFVAGLTDKPRSISNRGTHPCFQQGDANVPNSLRRFRTINNGLPFPWLDNRVLTRARSPPIFSSGFVRDHLTPENIAKSYLLLLRYMTSEWATPPRFCVLLSLNAFSSTYIQLWHLFIKKPESSLLIKLFNKTPKLTIRTAADLYGVSRSAHWP